jgi:hypothetical protein
VVVLLAVVLVVVVLMVVVLAVVLDELLLLRVLPSSLDSQKLIMLYPVSLIIARPRNNPGTTSRQGRYRDNLENEANFSVASHPFLKRCPINVCRE